MEAALALLVFLGLGGKIGPWLAGKFRKGVEADEVERLAKRFASSEELNGLRSSLEERVDRYCKGEERQFNGLRSSLEQRMEATESKADLAQRASQLALENADESLSQVAQLAVEQRYLSKRVTDEVMVTLQEFQRTQSTMRENLAGLTSLVDRLMKEWDEHRRGH